MAAPPLCAWPSAACTCGEHRLTPEERAVLDAALDVKDWNYGIDALERATVALRESRKPKPRYRIEAGRGVIWVLDDVHTVNAAYCTDRNEAERICRLLNEDEERRK
jgi:hypothetical protein